MSQKYQREIEEILRNMDRDEPGGGDRVSPFRRPRLRTPQGSRMSLSSLSTLLVVLSVVLMVVASGITFYEQTTSTLSGAFAVAAFIVFLLGLISGWRDHFRSPSLTIPPSRFQSPITGRGYRGYNEARNAPTPFTSFGQIPANDDQASPPPVSLRRGPIDTLRTRLRLFRLRQRYRREHED
ncbi:MAG TPA: hypothetical protein VKQ36_00320 [Ktedonobacterales bacterium]|nr:hypothetical protein [Ktedonobacterales bacterium]